MANIAIFRINYKSDFILTLNSDAGWMTPFCIKFWTGAPSQAYFASFDGTTYNHCAPVDGEPTKLRVQFDDHHLLIGDLQFQIGYHFTVDDFPTSVEDEVLNQASVIIEVDGEPAQVMLDLNGETAPEIEFSLPAYANEAQRIANEQERIAAEEARIQNEETRISAEQVRQQNETQRINNEAQRIHNEEARIAEFASLKADAIAATDAANAAASLANEKAQLASDKAALAQAAATLANEKAQLAADKAALAQAAATLANDKAALAQQKAEYAQTQGTYAKNQGDYAKAQGDYAKAQGDTALADHERAEADHTTAAADHTQAVADHTQAASDHTRAEADHSTASADHTTATSDHTQAGQDHTTAAADHTQAEQDHTRAESDHTRAESDHAAVEVYVDSLGAFDISAYHATGGVLAKYADLTAALGTDGANIPDALRKGGMSVKFVQSSDNKYVQYRLMSDTFNTTVANWQGVDEEPTAGSENLVKSGGVDDNFHNVMAVIGNDGYDITLTDNDWSGIAFNGTTFFDAPASGNYHSWVIEVFEGQEITLTNIIIPSQSMLLSSYPKIGEVASVTRIIDDIIENKKFIVNNNERYLFIGNTKMTSYNIIASKSGIKEQLDKLKSLKNKKIVCFGDSLTERADGTGKRYSDYMEELSEATIINVGIGGSQFKQRRPLTLTPSDVMDAFAALDVVSLIDAVCNQDFTYQQAAATYLDARPGEAGQKQAILDRLEAIDWSTIDAITVFAGTNDWAVSPDSNRIGQTGSTDRSYTLGAINEIIRMMSTTYPNIKIYWFTPTIRYLGRPDSILTDFDSTKWCDSAEGVQHYTLKEVVNLIINEVSLSHIPICNLYNMGWNQYNMINYFPASDGIHPNTVKGFTYIAKRILGFIYSENTI